jgi:hypothetical protein
MSFSRQIVAGLTFGALLLAGPQIIAQNDLQTLTKSELSYYFHSAPLAPIFLSEYEITVQPDRSVRLWYRFGPDNSARKTRNFQLDRQQYQTLIGAFAKASVLTGNWTPGATLIGASLETVSIREPSGKTVSISSALQPEVEASFRQVVDAMRATVPQAAWLQKDRDQKTYQDSAR